MTRGGYTSIPLVETGDYVRTRGGGTGIRCKAYRAPPSRRMPGGEVYIATIAPNTYLGPVEEYEYTSNFVTIEVRGYWINIWRAEVPHSVVGHTFASLVARHEVAKWKKNGWY